MIHTGLMTAVGRQACVRAVSYATIAACGETPKDDAA